MNRRITLKDGRTVNVRPITPDDREGLTEMHATMSPEALRWGMPPYTPENIQRRMDRLPNSIALAAEHGGRIVGHATINKQTHPRRRGVSGYNIYLHQDYHDAGLGTAMTAIILQEARDQGLHKVNLEVVAENTIAVHVYEKTGFKIEGRIRDTYYGEDESYHDTLMMGIILDEPA
jgi:RimJ/RimL family protein N-acetyltransferase